MKHNSANDPAVPSPAVWSKGIEQSMREDGMTMREWYAGQALAGMLARPDFKLFGVDGEEVQADLAAQNAFIIADAMLAAAKG